MKGMELMFDLETMGKGPKAAIVQIGACFFNPDGKIDSRFEVNVDLKSSMDYGLELDASTIEFWLEQPHKDFLGGELRANKHDLFRALRAFHDYASRSKSSVVWSHNAFDVPIIMNAFAVVSMKENGHSDWKPFERQQAMDLRTAYHQAGYKPDKSKNKRAHNALADCEFQVACLIEARKAMRSAVAV